MVQQTSADEPDRGGIPRAIYLGVFVGLLIVFGSRLLTYRLALFDTAVTANVYWMIIHGFGDVSQLTGSSHLAEHLSPVGLALSPVFLAGPTLGMFAWAAAQAASAVAIPIGVQQYARAAGLNRRMVTLVAVLALAAPVVYLTSQFGLREFSLGVGPLMLAAARTRSDGDRGAIWAVLAAATRIEFAFSVLLLGLTRRHSRGGMRYMMIGGGFGLAYLAWMLLGPGGGVSAGAHFGHLGTSIPEILGASLERPADAVRPFVEADWLPALIGWMAPFGLVVPLLKPRMLLPAVPFIALPILGTWELADRFVEHYWYPVAGLAAMAAVDALAQRKALVRPFVASSLAGLAMVWLLLFPWELDWLRPGLDRPQISDVIEELSGSDDSLAATAPIVHFAIDRPVIYALPEPFVCEGIGGSTRDTRFEPTLIAGPASTLEDLRVTADIDDGWDRVFLGNGYGIWSNPDATVLPGCESD